ncbi:MAG: 4Fe-4S binding protein [Candidatus Marinimicrobia bacterium]|nr:4Fe-4S binding protein [Candidatus Neomarinimicrobiota bacterium]
MIKIIQYKCDFCGSCVAVCPEDCIEMEEATLTIDQELCIDCELCVFICPFEVLEYVETAEV